MSYNKLIHFLTISSAFFFSVAKCHAQAPNQDHSCTVEVGGELAYPFGKDGKNFKYGGGFHAGGGFQIYRPSEPAKQPSLFLTANYMYDHLRATDKALGAAIATGGKPLASATSAHGNFSTVTLDVTARFPITLRTSVYALGGFGWLSRQVDFQGVGDAGTLLQSSGSTLRQLSANSGVYDAGVGVNFGLTHTGGLMLYAELRYFKGLAVNGGTALLPLSVGIRW